MDAFDVISGHLCDDIDVNRIKRQLTSRDDNIKVRALQILIQYIRKSASVLDVGLEHVVNELLEADMAEFLCEAMATRNCLVLNLTFECLEIFLESKNFGSQGCVVHVIECVRRSIYILLMDARANIDCINKALLLLGFFIERFSSSLTLTHLLGSDENITYAFQSVTDILQRREACGYEMVVNASLVFCCLLEGLHRCTLFRNCSVLPLLPKLIEKNLLSLFDALNHLPNMKLKILALTLKIGATALRISSQLMDEDMDDDDDDDDGIVSCPKEESLSAVEKIKLKEKIVDAIVPHIWGVWYPVVSSAELNRSSSGLFLSFLRCFLHLYQMDDFDNFKLSHKLAEEGFTMLLPMLLSWSSSCGHTQLKTTIEGVFLEYIFSLTVENLDVSSWPEGTDALKKYLASGCKDLPAKFSDWLWSLDEPVPESQKHFIILFVYFLSLFMPCDSPTIIPLDPVLCYLPRVCDLSFPTLILKPFFFVYIVAVLSHQSVSAIKSLARCTEELLNAVTRKNFKEVYTHHPATLFWLFSSSRIPVNLQFEMVSIWLEKEHCGKFDPVVVRLVLANNDVTFCLMDILKFGREKVVESAARILCKAITVQLESGCEEILSLLWENLPNTLTSFCSRNPQIKGYNISFFMQVTSTHIPTNLNYNSALRSSNIIMRILKRAYEEKEVETRGPAIRLCLYILLASMERRDLRALLSYLNQPSFLLLVYETSGFHSSKRVLPSIQLLTHLNHFYLKAASQIQQDGNVLSIDALHILYLLIQHHYDILMYSLHFLHIILTQRLPNPVMEVVTPGYEFIQSPIVEIIFRHLQNICAMKDPNISRNVLKCMGTVLQYTAEVSPDDNLFPKLASHPWTHIVIQMVLMGNKYYFNSELLYFLTWWYEYYVRKNCSQLTSRGRVSQVRNRRPFCRIISETTELVAKVIVNKLLKKDDETNSLAIVVLKKILLADIEISKALNEKIRRALTKEHSIQGSQMN